MKWSMSNVDGVEVVTGEPDLPGCENPLNAFGMESAAIPDGSITASSFMTNGYEPYHGRLNGADGLGCWMSFHNPIREWLQVDLGEMKTITGTVIQGNEMYVQRWVTTYKLQYSAGGVGWITYVDFDLSDKIFPGNMDASTPVFNLLDNTVEARYVRFYPQSWEGAQIAMRVEILGCSITAFCRQYGREHTCNQPTGQPHCCPLCALLPSVLEASHSHEGGDSWLQH
ncbi:lactadherin-like isoform X1 [Branchiostoma floridae x Branchiostoma belcheri]